MHYLVITASGPFISELVQHVVRQWIKTQPKTVIPSDSNLRKTLPAVFSTRKLRTDFVKTLGHFWEQRMLRMLRRLGIRAQHRRKQYQIAAGGVKKEVRCSI